MDYRCPTDPNACTIGVGTLTANASASLSAGPAEVGCHLTVVLSTTVAIDGTITVTVTPGNANVVIPTSVWSVNGLQPGSNKTLTIPFTFVPVSGLGLINIYVAYGMFSDHIPQMNVILS